MRQSEQNTCSEGEAYAVCIQEKDYGGFFLNFLTCINKIKYISHIYVYISGEGLVVESLLPMII